MNTIFDLIKTRTEKKKCRKCGEWKVHDDFHNSFTVKDKLQPYCKECSFNATKEFYKKNTEYKRLYYEKNRKRILEQSKSYWKKQYSSNKEFRKDCLKKSAEYRKSCDSSELIKVRKIMSDKIIKKYGFLLCQQCKKTKNQIHDFHHIVYRSEAPRHTNLNHEKNLICVCRSCHSFFHTKKSNRDKLINKRKLWELFPELHYLKNLKDE